MNDLNTVFAREREREEFKVTDRQTVQKILILISVVNMSQIKHTWFSFVFQFVTDFSNYNAVVFTGKRRTRMEGVQAFILSMKRESQNKTLYGKSHKEYRKPT